MINSTLKSYNFYDFNLKFVSSCFKKNELSICESQNVNYGLQTIKPLNNFVEFFSKKFSESDLNSIKTKNETIINNLIYVYEYIYFIQDLGKYETRIFVLDKNFNLFELNSDLIFDNMSIKFETVPKVFENNSKLYFFSPNDKFILIEKNNKPLFVTDFLNIKNFLQFQNKIFFMTHEHKFSIFISEELELENIGSNIDEYELFKLNPNSGEVLGLIVLNNYLFVVQQYSISKLSFSNGAWTNSLYFPIQTMIIEESIQQIDDFIVFCTESGVFIFDGSNIKHLFKELDNKIDKNDISTAVFNEKYYLNCSFSLNNNFERVIFEFDIDKDTFNLFYLKNVTKIYSIKTIKGSSLIAVKEEDNNQILTLISNSVSTEKKFVKFNPVTFEDSLFKTLSDISIFANGRFDFKIKSDFSEKTISVNNNIFLKNLGLKGNYFQFEISSDDNFEIFSIMINVLLTSEKPWLIHIQHWQKKP